MDVGAVKGSTIRRSQSCKRSRQSVSTSPNRFFRSTALMRKASITLAARHRLPAVYSNRTWCPAGGLISYGADPFDQYRRAAGYVDRILKGEKPADLPVQTPTKFENLINLKT